MMQLFKIIFEKEKSCVKIDDKEVNFFLMICKNTQNELSKCLRLIN